MDANGIQVGTAKTLNSNHQANIGEPITIKAGTSQTFTVAGNMAAQATLANHAGEVPTFEVTSINTSAAVSGSLPITGTSQVINATLSLGTATLYISSFDPNVASNQNIGTTGYRFAGVRILAGSNEDIRVHSIRWNQSGSASAGDLPFRWRKESGAPTRTITPGLPARTTAPCNAFIDAGAADARNEMIDLHCHLLPAIDDGATSWEPIHPCHDVSRRSGSGR